LDSPWTSSDGFMDNRASRSADLCNLFRNLSRSLRCCSAVLSNGTPRTSEDLSMDNMDASSMISTTRISASPTILSAINSRRWAAVTAKFQTAPSPITR
jgi:hypothetical protein